MPDLSNYAKFIVLVCGFIVLIANELLTPGFGLPEATVHVLSVLVAVATGITHMLSTNAFQPTVPPGHVIVAANDAKPGVKIVFSRAAAILAICTMTAAALLLHLMRWRGIA